VNIVRNPLSLKKLVYLDGQQAVLYRSKMNPFLGRNFEALEPLEWLARMSDHIPDPGKHRTHFYAHYANRVRGERPSEALGHQKHEEEQSKKRRCPPSWARLIAKVFQTDPLNLDPSRRKEDSISFQGGQGSSMRRSGQIGPAEVMLALSHGWL
jgi:putative transposase